MIESVLFLGWLIINRIVGLSSRVSFSLGLTLLIVVILFTAFGHAGAGLKIIIFVFLFLLAGSIMYFFELIKNEK